MTIPPTLQEYWTASNAAYGDNAEGNGTDSAPPNSTGLTLLVDSNDINKSWLADGFFAQAFKDASGNIIIAFEGSILDLGDQSSYAQGSRLADAFILLGLSPPAFSDANAFVQDVKQYLVGQGLGSSPIYLTGHSLGGAEAEYVASQGNESGATFGAPGAPSYRGPSAGQNFVNYIDYGDPVGSVGPSHFGTVQYIGPPSDKLVLAALDRGLGPALGFAAGVAIFHPLAHYEADLVSKQFTLVQAIASFGGTASIIQAVTSAIESHESTVPTLLAGSLGSHG